MKSNEGLIIRIAGIGLKLRKLLTGQPDTGTSLWVILFYYGIKAKRNRESTTSLTAYG
jgi:hypothetical protein